MTKKVKNYEVTFESQTTGTVTYPIEATSKQKAAEEFSRQFIGRVAEPLTTLVKVVQVKDKDDEANL